jgi:hypothetical protein
MQHTRPPALCARCLEYLSLCHPDIIDFVTQIQKVFLDCHVCQGFRNKEDQHAAFAADLSKLDWPMSRHNHTENEIPKSMAVDLFRLDEHNKAQFEDGYYKRIYNYYLSNKLSFKHEDVHWGGNYLHFKDLDHFEILKTSD